MSYIFSIFLPLVFLLFGSVSAEESTTASPAVDSATAAPVVETSVGATTIPESTQVLPPTETQEPQALTSPISAFVPFTGQITGNKVRLRSKADLESLIIKQLFKDDLLVVVGEEGNFWKVEPPSDVKFYVFRSYILDNVVEAHRVNIRLRPDTEAPIIGQLQKGEQLTTSNLSDKKWLEISSPTSVKFYVSKEYIKNVGDKDYFAKTLERKQNAANILTQAFLLAQEECKKTFEEMKPLSAMAKFEEILENYSDFPDYVRQAKEGVALLHENFLQKKVTYLALLNSEAINEGKTEEVVATEKAAIETSSQPVETKMQETIAVAESKIAASKRITSHPKAKLFGRAARKAHEEKTDVEFSSQPVAAEASKAPAVVESKITHTDRITAHPQAKLFGRAARKAKELSSNEETVSVAKPVQKIEKVETVEPVKTSWELAEEALFAEWSPFHPEKTQTDFYKEQEVNAVTLRGTVEKFDLPIHNKPGEYLLKNQDLAVAYLYSTKIDLKNFIGKEVVLIVSSRPNQHFAFPAYFVNYVEESSN